MADPKKTTLKKKNTLCVLPTHAHPNPSAATTATASHSPSQSATTIVGLFGSVLGVDANADSAVSPTSHTIVGQVNVRYFTDGGGKVSDKAATAVDDSNFPPGADHFLSTIAREMCEKICTATFDINLAISHAFLKLFSRFSRLYNYRPRRMMCSTKRLSMLIGCRLGLAIRRYA